MLLVFCIAVGTAQQVFSPDWDEAMRRMSQNTKDILDVGRSQASAHPTTID
jgi:hypothetical protein